MIGGGKIKLKVCGMRDPSNISQINEQPPDYMGFIFYEGSPRYVGNNFMLPSNFPTDVKKVGVFVNETFEQIQLLVKRHGLEVLQLHGTESPDLVERLRESGVSIFKVFSIDDNFDFGTLNAYSDYVDFFLFDTKGKYYGGNAETFNWNVLEKYNQKVPFILSGGIAPGNIDQISELKDMNLYAIDVNSGVEAEPALKDVAKVRDIQRKLADINHQENSRL